MNFTPENISELEPNQVFVFGSNLAGEHVGGAAKVAREKFGAEWGVGEGMTGRCYAFPTLTEDLDQIPHWKLEKHIDNFFKTALDNPDKEFILTKVGCGIANYPEKYMKALFVDSPKNVIKPEGWHANMRSQPTLDEFVKYCQEHPEERFWQALRNWSKAGSVLWWDQPSFDTSNLTKAQDTFYWEGKNQ